MIDLIFASIIQGITEFIPVSSSLHLLIYGSFFSSKTLTLLIIATMHLGSIFALVIFSFVDTKLEMNVLKSIKFNKVILIASLPIFLFGFLFYDLIADTNQINNLIIITTIVFGIVLFISDHYSKNKKTLSDISYYDSIVIGLFQCFSLIPGVSRSASTIIASRVVNINRESSIIFSFILSAPVIVGAFCLTLYKINTSQLIIINDIWFEVLFSLIFSFISSYITLKYFYKFSRVNGFTIFAIYRVLLGIILYISV